MKTRHTRSRRHLLLSGAIALALYAMPVTYDFEQGHWQPNAAFAKCCFTGDTQVRMSDGSLRAIATLHAGERVMAMSGGTNRILAVEPVILGNRLLYGLNGLTPFFTAEHPFLTRHGWAAINPTMTRAENRTLKVRPLLCGMILRSWFQCEGTEGGLALAPALGETSLTTLYQIKADPFTPLFNLRLDGDHTYFAWDFVVHNKDGEGGGGGSDSGGG
ncbi:Hint domain-containing protein, partial [Aeromonas diversa]